MIELGIVLLFLSVFCIVIGIILFLVSIRVQKLRKPAMYTLLAAGISMLVSLGLCTAAQ